MKIERREFFIYMQLEDKDFVWRGADQPYRKALDSVQQLIPDDEWHYQADVKEWIVENTDSNWETLQSIKTILEAEIDGVQLE